MPEEEEEEEMQEDAKVQEEEELGEEEEMQEDAEVQEEEEEEEEEEEMEEDAEVQEEEEEEKEEEMQEDEVQEEEEENVMRRSRRIRSRRRCRSTSRRRKIRGRRTKTRRRKRTVRIRIKIFLPRKAEELIQQITRQCHLITYYILHYILLSFSLSCLSNYEYLNNHFWINLCVAVTVLCSIYLHYLRFNDILFFIFSASYIPGSFSHERNTLLESDTFNLELDGRFISKSLKS